MTASNVVEQVDGIRLRGPRFAELRASTPVILPSLLLCDFGHLADEIARLEAAGVQALHLDVMDGHFVPNLTYGPMIVEAVRKHTALPIEAHLMISNPADYIRQFHDAGADHLTIHFEAVADPRPVLEQIHGHGCSAGLAINPPTPLSAIDGVVDLCDSILVMSVMPGFGGQKFDPRALDKLKQLRDRPGSHPLLGIDGGIHESTIGPAAAAGAQLFAVGSAIFAPNSDYGHALAELSRLARKGIVR
ncbi:MAG TPA: ribulose-phosphate 3-epimerase [Pirellulales bacterium]|nr:ribulose-phosphate 3-epimerase [Pirellulales bacterium]